jgi:hypothetical protein
MKLKKLFDRYRESTDIKQIPIIANNNSKHMEKTDSLKILEQSLYFIIATQVIGLKIIAIDTSIDCTVIK